LVVRILPIAVEFVLQGTDARLQLPEIFHVEALGQRRQRNVAHQVLCQQLVDELVHVRDLVSLC
jgi:hypothetical protein